MNWSDIASIAGTLFLIMDPLGNAPVFNAVLSRVDAHRRMRILLRELLIALGILIGVLLVGNTLMAFLGLSQPSLSIAGGILLFIISLRMIFPNHADTGDTRGEEDPLIVPMAVPLIAGPSTIAVLLLLSSNSPERRLEWGVSLLIAWLATSAILLAAPKVLEKIGRSGTLALERLMGMILVILSTQMLLNGIRDFVHSL